jgi:putative transposase
MCSLIFFLFVSFRSWFQGHLHLQAEIVALRHQLMVPRRSQRGRVQLRATDRFFWVGLSRLWSGWCSALAIVKPETVISWHRKGFRLYWAWKSGRGTPGMPEVSEEVRDLIRKMSKANPLWGAPRIHGELLKLGSEVSQATVAKYMARQRKPPSQTWRTFLNNHVKELVSTDFFVVLTLSFRVLYVFIVLVHDRRRVLHFNVAAHPSAEWTAQQMAEAFPWDSAPRYLLHDRDSIYGDPFRQRVREMGMRQVLTAPRSPWQKDYASYCTSLVRFEGFSKTRGLFESLTPCIFRGGFVPGCSYKHSFLSL